MALSGTKPDCGTGWTDRFGRDSHDLRAERRKIKRVAQPLGQAIDDEAGVVASAVEATIDDSLDPSADRLEEREGTQRRNRHRQGLAVRDSAENALDGHDPRPE